MNLQQFLQQFVLTKKSTQKSNVTSIKGGKWYIPEDKMKEFYDIVSSQEKIDIPLVEKINDIHPLIFDLDLKYKSVLTERSYTEDAIESLIEHLWKEMKEFIKRMCIEKKIEWNDETLEKIAWLFSGDKDENHPSVQQTWKKLNKVLLHMNNKP